MLQPVAILRSPFAEKFGVPRQGNLAPNVISTLVPQPGFENPDFRRGIEQFSHLWLIWGFHKNESQGYRPTVRPPRLGGNTRLGVFATRSPFRPNGLGLSVVRLLSVEADGSMRISGADMVNGTPVYDIKPYIPYADAIPDASAGFTEIPRTLLQVVQDCPLPQEATPEWRQAMQETLAQDPRPAYQEDPLRLYHLILSPFELTFRVEDGVAHVISVTPAP